MYIIQNYYFWFSIALFLILWNMNKCIGNDAISKYLRKGIIQKNLKERQTMELSYWMEAFVSMVRKPVFLFSYSTENRSVHAQSLQSCPALCNLMDCSPPDSSVHGTLQARMLEWVAISFSKMRVYSIIK